VLCTNTNDWSGEELWKAYMQLAEKAGFIKIEQYDLKPYHYGIVLTKKESVK